jgi:predicted nucleic acid-binding protein
VVLVDTSVWVSHLRDGNEALAELLEAGEVVCHPLIIGELACGHLANRAAILALLSALPSAATAEHGEILGFIEAHELWGKGLGYVDLHLLASALLTKVPLWTLDRRLDATARRLRCRFELGRPGNSA